MNNNKLFIFLFALSFSFFGHTQFPGCPAVDAGPDKVLDCSTTCVDLIADPFKAGATTTYAVESIQHTPPVNYGQAGGTGVSIGIDDRWSSVINLPFDFCFYGETYNTAKVGSNGAISLGSGQGTYHPWQFSAAVPSTALTDAGNIFGPYHDVDPSLGGNINYYLLGSAPCRIFAVVFEDLPHYNSSKCPGKRSSFMMVLYETTNAIDVYIERKDLCTNWNSGNAVVGIQNHAGTEGITPTGRNTGNWSVSASNSEGWRFSPDGAPIYTVEWLEGGNVIATGDTVNVCASGPTTFTARATYESCNGGNTVVVEDDILVTPNPSAPVLSEVSVTSANCSASDGSLEVETSNAVSPLEYSIDNGTTFQSSGVFDNLPSGSYDVIVEDDNGCQGAITIEVTEINPVTLAIDSTNISCHGEVDGQITLNASNGAAPYTYSIDGGPPQTNNEFTDLAAGTYQVEVEDNNGCVQTTSVEIIEPGEIELTVGSIIDASCYGFNDGEISTNISGGFPDYTYTINDSISQSASAFDSLFAGQYEIIVEDMNGCSDTIETTVSQPAAPITEITTTDTLFCMEGSTQIETTGVSSGSFSATPSGLTLSANTGTINLENSSPGNYDIVYSFNENGCPYTDTLPIVVAEQPEIIIEDTIELCLGESWTPNATGADNYDWTGGLTNGVSVPGELGTETFIVTGTSSEGCSTMDTVIVITHSQPNVSFSANPTNGYPPLPVSFENTSSGANSYLWDFGDGATEQNNSPMVNHIFQNTGVYEVILTGLTNGKCPDTATLQINVTFPDMIYDIPNIYTPNGDSDNDFFKLINPENIQSLEVTILNRWGNLVFESDDVLFKWNGQRLNSGAECNDGTYFYKITLTNYYGEDRVEHGFVHLIRDN